MTLFNQISMIQFDITEVCLYGGGCMHFVFFILRYKHMLLIYPVYIGYSLNDAIGEILNRLKCYFEKAILVILLYRNERHYYNEAIANNVSPSSIYGIEHLLCLFGMISHK